MKRTVAVLLAIGSFTVAAPSVESAAGRCRQYETAINTYAPKGGWNVAKMSRTMWRESRCTPWVRSRSRDSGLLQINDVNLPYLSSKMGFRVTSQSLMDPQTNIRAAALLCSYARKAWGSCYVPWSGGA